MGLPRVLLFDLGGVLIEFVGFHEMPGLLKESLEPEAIRSRWITSPAIIRFELGKCSRKEFAKQFVDEWDLAIEADEFLEMFASWSKPPFAGTRELLVELRGRFTLACLSNTSELHWQIMLDKHKLRPHFDRCYASHLMGISKPDPQIFMRVAHDIGCKPNEIAYFDDGEENVAGARATGIKAYLVQGHDELRSTLRQIGVL